ncbi:hypothetical protein D3C78_1377200 [compost metagenome]
MDATAAPGPEQRHGRMPEIRHGVMTGAGDGLLVQLLLDLIDRHLQIQTGEVLPAGSVGAVPGVLR